MQPFPSVHRGTGAAVFDASGAPKLQVFIPAKVWDNRRLLASDPAYLARQQNLPEHMRKAWLEGDWDVAAGGYLAGVWDPVRHVVAPFLPPAEWPRWRAMDWRPPPFQHRLVRATACRQPHRALSRVLRVERQPERGAAPRPAGGRREDAPDGDARARAGDAVLP